MAETRRKAVIAIKDLINKSHGGILITGREHYFNSQEEMLSCFGLESKDVEIIHCSDEFSTEEIAQYLEQIAQYKEPIRNNIF